MSCPCIFCTEHENAWVKAYELAFNFQEDKLPAYIETIENAPTEEEFQLIISMFREPLGNSNVDIKEIIIASINKLFERTNTTHEYKERLRKILSQK